MSYLGGKGQDGVYQTIINQMPFHRMYVEPFLGGGSVMLKKSPARWSIGIDLDEKALGEFALAARSKGLDVTLVKADGIEWLRRSIEIRADCRPVMVYCDPPYLHSTRSCERSRYDCEMDDEAHIELLDCVRQVKWLVAISTYPNEMYERALSDWRLVEFQSVARSGEQRTEWLFMNYEEPSIPHDWRYTGRNYNQRQDIARRIDRTRRKLLQWSPVDRVRLLSELLPVMSSEELGRLQAYLPVRDLKVETPVPAGRNAYRILLQHRQRNLCSLAAKFSGIGNHQG